MSPVAFARSRFSMCVVVLLVGLPAGSRADESLPVIVTYELRKDGRQAYLAARDPKAFWIGQIVARIENRTPAMPAILSAPATVTIHFVLGRDGRLVTKKIIASSGLPPIDASALAMVDAAQPFPPMPDTLADATIAFDVPIRFRPEVDRHPAP